ncbi:hypothetical protein EDC01DRAFT_633336 [Geopyxis carbonaria]|nr:hypothetical protein EDC01DRAFT_633336 [Geopyxis carbonaria]
MKVLLNDKRGGQRATVWDSLKTWANCAVDKEFAKAQSNKENNATLRYSKRKAGTYGSAQLLDFQSILETQCPLSWSIFQILAAKSSTDPESAMPAVDESSLNLMPLTAAMILMYSRNSQVNGFQVLFSVFCYSHRTQKRAMEVMHKLGLVLDYSWINHILTAMAEENQARLQARAMNVPHLISMDNVNRQLGTRDPTIINKSYIDNSTSGFAVNLRGLPASLTGKCGIPRSWYKPGLRQNLSASSMAPSSEPILYFAETNKAHFMDIIEKYCYLKFNRSKCFPTPKVKRLSPKADFEIFTFALMDVEQGSVDGNRESLRRATLKELGYSQNDLIDIVVLVSGDQLTMDRYRSLRALHETDLLGEQFNWIIPIMGLFHLSMNYLKMLLKNHMGKASDPSSLACCNAILQRPRINDKVADFWAVMDLVNDCLDAYILAMLITETRSDNLQDFTRKICASENDESGNSQEAEVNVGQVVSELVDKHFMFNSVHKMRYDAKSGEPRSGDHRDAVYENALLYVRHALQFRDFYTSVRSGDVGRISHLLELWTPQFIGASQHRYACELLNHQCGMKIEYNKQLRQLILQNILINPGQTGGHFLSVDEFMEEVVRHVKHIYNPGGAAQAEKYAREVVARVIVSLINTKKELRMGTIGKHFGGNHNRPTKTADIGALLDNLIRKMVFKPVMGRGFSDDDAYTQVTDWMQLGLQRLSEGRYWDQYVVRSMKRGASMLDMEGLQDEQLGEIAFPDD